MIRCKQTKGTGQCIKELNHGGKHTLPSVHECHWPTCNIAVSPKMWGCKKHWFKLPKSLRNKIWATYVPGQEVTKTPSRLYIRVALEVQDWCIFNPD